MPDDFAPALSVYQNKIIHQWTAGGVKFEAGYPIDQDSPRRRRLLAQQIWEATEEAIAGNHHLVRYLSRDRHKGHPVSIPELSIASENH